MIKLIDGLNDNSKPNIFYNYAVKFPTGFASVRLKMVRLGFNVRIDDARYLLEEGLLRGYYLK